MFAVGERVVVRGLTRSKEHNGSHGTVVRVVLHDGAVARLHVACRSGTLSVAPCHLMRAPPLPDVVLDGLHLALQAWQSLAG